MLDAVDAGADQAGEGVGAEDVGGDPGAGGVGGVDRGHQHVVGPQRRQVADAAVDPVADELHPAVPRRPGRRPRSGSSAGSSRSTARPGM